MKAVSTYSIRLDEKVPLTMLAISILALFFTAFRYNSYKPCNAFELKAYSNYFDVGSTIFFNAKDAKNAESWEWDFGDKTPIDKTSGSFANHIYTQPGRYLITLTINGHCKQLINVSINNIVKDTLHKVMPQVIWPSDPINVGQNVIFSDNTNGAYRWDWYIGEGKDSKQFSSKDVSFTFQKPGVVIVKVFINGDPDSYQEKAIAVSDVAAPKMKPYVPIASNKIRPQRPDIKDRPSDGSILSNNTVAAPEVKTPQAPRLTNDLFLKMIRGVVEKTVIERDFEPYLCGNKNVRVSFNGDDIGFSECITRLRKIKRLKSLKANAYTDPGTNCILGISIAYEKKGILGL